MSSLRRILSAEWQSYADLLGLAVDGIADVVEEIHCAIPLGPVARQKEVQSRANGIAGLAYRAVHGINGVTVAVVRSALATASRAQNAGLLPSRPDNPASLEHASESLTAVLNGVIGDRLAAKGSALAITMQIRARGVPVPITADALANAYAGASGRLVLMVHGLCMNDLQWRRHNHDHGEALARDLGLTPLYLHYNTGRHIHENGLDLACLLERLTAAWPCPVDEINIVGHSMGGLVARSAVHHARESGKEWPERLERMVFLGTPHHGAPLERIGSRVNAWIESAPYLSALARLGDVRSNGITDLYDGAVCAPDAAQEITGASRRAVHVPLPKSVRCHAIAATLGQKQGDWRDLMLGDGLVPLDSALGRHQDKRLALQFSRRQWTAHATGHLDLLSDTKVYKRIRTWFSR
ncbi:PGAP1-like alpha/beta domain-containing protein [Noviherbaspirillum galbum]|uniref:Alpha/beta hydrolase n=1 Tax=Noviherbaspirillum galbum TaxID=2709383 RepID=A0A6B3SJU3_9BURK|nr:alpha/beta hydrolase [Noviherbaspirillum galbum]NEX61023.1 alpha/beta hydrolase [Noviherbaspirillum galbum]